MMIHLKNTYTAFAAMVGAGRFHAVTLSREDVH